MNQVHEKCTSLSVVIPVRNRWGKLKECLDSITSQDFPCNMEVIIIDDGSDESMPDNIISWEAPFSFQYLRQTHLGIAAARNAGIKKATNDIILFIDSDCILQKNCLKSVVMSVVNHPQDEAFQLALTGADRNIAGCMEKLRLEATQQCLQSSSGYIQYVNTAGFAVRRTYAQQRTPFFNVAAIRGSDTFVLAQILDEGIKPRFLPQSLVAHQCDMHFLKYILKHFWIGYLTAPSRQRLNTTHNALMNNSQRKKVLFNIWQKARLQAKDLIAFLLLIPAFLFELCGRMTFSIIGMYQGRTEVLGVPVDGLLSSELQYRAISAAESREQLYITYLTAWSLVLAQQNSEFQKILGEFDYCYADGMGVVYSLWIMSRKRIKKVTAIDFFFDLCKECARKKFRIAFVGAEDAVIKQVRKKLTAEVKGLNITICSSGFFSHYEKLSLIHDLAKEDPHIIFVGMGQPAQEQFVLSIKKELPGSVIWCVGGLFDYIAGKYPHTPKFIRNYGFEWLWRLTWSPKQYWRRYIIGLPQLVLYILRSNIFCLLSYVKKAKHNGLEKH